MGNAGSVAQNRSQDAERMGAVLAKNEEMREMIGISIDAKSSALRLCSKLLDDVHNLSRCISYRVLSLAVTTKTDSLAIPSAEQVTESLRPLDEVGAVRATLARATRQLLLETQY